MTPIDPPPAATRRRRRLLWGLIAILIAALGVVAAVNALTQISGRTTNVTISLSYVGDDGQMYSCTYDYSTPDRLPMPAATAASMNARDWSETGQLIYDWAKNHPAETWTTQDELSAEDPRSTRADASWSLAMDRFIEFPPWTIDAGDGPEYALWWEARQGSNCEDGLR